MKSALLVPPLLVMATVSLAEWRVEDDVAVARPSATNSNIEAVAIFCGNPVSFEVRATDGPVRPEDFSGEADYFYEADRVIAEIDDAVVPLMALGAGHAVVLEAQDDEGGIGRLGMDFVEALRRGRNFTLAFDVTPEDDPETGSPFETVAHFSLAGSARALGEVFSACGRPPS